jgi:hypothetical protein
VKPILGTTIRFLGSSSARPSGAIHLQFALPRGRLGLSTSMACFIYFELIIQVPTKPKGEPMIHFVEMGWFHLVFVLVLLNIHEICLKLKSGFRIICKFPTFQKPYFCIYFILAMAGPSNPMKPERFGGGKNFHHWQNKVKFSLMSMGLWWVIHPMMPLTVPQVTAYPTACDSALSGILTLLANNLYDIYLKILLSCGMHWSASTLSLKMVTCCIFVSNYLTSALMLQSLSSRRLTSFCSWPERFQVLDALYLIDLWQRALLSNSLPHGGILPLV